MRLGPLRWVVAFFTRPIHLSDVAALLRPLKRPAKQGPAVAKAAPVDDDADRPVRPRAKPSGAPRPPVAPVRDPALDVAVSEQPLDTLPADLQSEFGVTASPAVAPPRSHGDGKDG
jgi:hypothetical protein